jgi:hypothetical protein
MFLERRYGRRMADDVVASRELRNDTAGLLRRSRRSWIRRGDLATRLSRAQADPGLHADLTQLAGETTDDLGPIR